MATTQTTSRHRVTMTAWTNSGEGGIRTPGPISETQHFQCCTIGRSVTSPRSDTSIGNYRIQHRRMWNFLGRDAASRHRLGFSRCHRSALF